MMTYIKAILLIGSLLMAAQTILIRGNEELGILYLILFTAFRELWELDCDRQRNNRIGRNNSQKTTRNKKCRERKSHVSRRNETIARGNLVS
jgi:hypothetical protein